jgi:hypothetical protein
MDRRGWATIGILGILYVAAGTYWLVNVAPAAQAASAISETATPVSAAS